MDSKQSDNSSVGVIFLIIGIVSALITAFIFYLKAGSDDFYYVTSTVNGITTTEYNPAFVIAMLAFCTLFSVAFIVVGIIMIRRKSAGGCYSESMTSSLSSYYRDFQIHGMQGNQTPILPTAFIGIGLLVLTIGGALLAWDRTSLRSLDEVVASVTRVYSVSHHQSGGRTYYADIAYKIDGRSYQSRITVSSFFRDEQVTVYCNPEQPLRCRLDAEYLVWYLILFPCGLIFTFGGLLIRRHLLAGR